MQGSLGTADVKDYTIMDHIWVYKMMYAVINSQNSNSNQYYNGVIKISGNPRSLSSSTGTLTVDVNYFRPYWGNNDITIRNIIGLEQYGFFLTTWNSNTQT
jgi:hypothetical protein